MYRDPGHPFGHELCLYSMLTISEPSNYPWNLYLAERGGNGIVALAPKD